MPLLIKNPRVLTASTVLSGLILTSAPALAADSAPVDEPSSGSRTHRVPIQVIPASAAGWNDLTACTVYGTIAISAYGATPAATGADALISKSNYSIRVQPYRNAQNEIVIDAVADEVIFEIFADDEVEGAETLTYYRTAYGISCDDGAPRNIGLTGAYGSFMITEAAEVPTLGNEIPVRQKSLSTQLKSLRTLSLHNSITRDRSIAKEIDRARKNAGLRTDNLQVRINGSSLPAGSPVGGAAGDTVEDFGRWGTFVTGSIDVGEQDKNSAVQSDFRSNMVIAGIDYKLTDNTILGAALTHSDMNAGNDQTANTDFNRYSLTLFGSVYSSDAFYLDMMLTYGTSRYDLSRRIGVVEGEGDIAFADTDGDELSASLGAGYNWHYRNVNLRLFSFLDYIDSDINAYSEFVTGTSSAAMVNGLNLQSLTGNLGAELSWNINTGVGVFTPMMSIAQEHQYADDSVYVSGRFIGGQDEGSFAYSAPTRDNNYLNAQLGLNAVLKNGISAFVSYDTFVAREDFASAQYSLGMRWEY